jgi:hypothetical protein
LSNVHIPSSALADGASETASSAAANRQFVAFKQLLFNASLLNKQNN